MKNQDVTNRYVEVFKPGTQIVRTLPLGGKILKGNIVIDGPVVVSGGSASGTAHHQEVWAGLVKRFRLRTSAAPGSRYPDGLLKDLSARSVLHRAATYRHKYIDEQAALACNGGAATYNVHIEFPFFFALPDMKRPIEYALNADESAYQTIKWEIDLGTRDTLFDGNDRTWDFSGVTVEFTDDRENVDGDTYVVIEEDHELLIPNVTDRLEDRAMWTTGALMDLFLLTQTGTEASGPVLSDAILKEVRISGGAIDLYLKSKNLKQALYDDGVFDAAQSAVGRYLINFCRSGMNTKVVDPNTMDLKFNVLNPSGSNNDSILINARRLVAPTGFVGIQPGTKGKNS